MGSIALVARRADHKRKRGVGGTIGIDGARQTIRWRSFANRGLKCAWRTPNGSETIGRTIRAGGALRLRETHVLVIVRQKRHVGAGQDILELALAEA